MIWAWIRNFLSPSPSWENKVLWLHQMEWETVEITYEPLSILSTEDPVPCAAYAKENDLLAVEDGIGSGTLQRKI